MLTEAERREAINNRLKAMQHPLRRRVLLYLQEHGVKAPSELADVFEESTQNISHHLKQLAKLGCAELVEERKVGPSIKHFYRHTERHLIDVGEWEEIDDPLIKEGLLVDFMQPAVDDFTNGVKAQTLGRDEHWHVTRTPLKGMDQQGLEKALKIHERAFREIMDLQTECAERMEKSGETPISVSSFQGCFEVPHF